MAGQSEGTTTLVQERQELMVSSSLSATPILRLAHFLIPSDNSIHGSAFHPPPKPVPSSDLDTKESHVGFNLRCWNNPPPEWKEWVDLMYSKHQTLWKKTGIFEAVLNSKYTICRDEGLLHAFAARWCSETNTFVLPWGEATLTLEDMTMLGGYSVLGDPVFSPLDTHKLKDIERILEHERSDLSKTKSKKASHSAWLGKFMNSGNEIEHEAFLVYWLSRFVFPLASDSIVKCVFPVAIHLANGTKIALAPAVLASIYSDLNAYKEAVFLSERLVGSKYEERIPPDVLVSSPFRLIQIWVWERFPILQPKPKIVKPEAPSFAKWHDLKRNGSGIVTNVTGKVFDSFVWQPYTTIGERFLPSKIKGRKEQCLSVTLDTDEEVEAMVRILRVSELVGIETDCIEHYLPHRVARQFHFDQDIPGLVERANSDHHLAWGNYNRPIENRRFCFPSHLYEPSVTVRYLEWWKKPVSAQDIDCEAFEDEMTLRELKKRKLMVSAREKPEDAVCGPEGSTTCNALKKDNSKDKEFLENSESSNSSSNFGARDTDMEHSRVFGDGMSYKRLMKTTALKSAAKKPDDVVLVPPGYPSKCNKASTAKSSYAEDVESNCNNVKDIENGVVSNAFVEKTSNHVKKDEVESIRRLPKDPVIDFEARISNLETILAKYKSDRGLA